MDEDPSDVDGSSNYQILHDSSGLENHLYTMSGSKTTSTARYGNALESDGDDDYVCSSTNGSSCTDNDNLDVGIDNFTIGFWMRTNDSSAVRFLSKYPSDGWVIQKDTDSINVYVNDDLGNSVGYSSVITFVDPDDGNWHCAFDVAGRSVTGTWNISGGRRAGQQRIPA
jgi:hypothetical protein